MASLQSDLAETVNQAQVSSQGTGTNDTATQQASTSQGNGPEVENVEPSPEPQKITRNPVRKPSFKEQVVGYAKVTRGTLLGKTKVKEHGEKILGGEQTFREPSED